MQKMSHFLIENSFVKYVICMEVKKNRNGNEMIFFELNILILLNFSKTFGFSSKLTSKICFDHQLRDGT